MLSLRGKSNRGKYPPLISSFSPGIRREEEREPRTPQTTQPSGCQIASLCPLGSPRPVSPCTLTPPHTSPGPLRTLAISDEIFCKDK